VAWGAALGATFLQKVLLIISLSFPDQCCRVLEAVPRPISALTRPGSEMPRSGPSCSDEPQVWPCSYYGSWSTLLQLCRLPHP